jgi:RHS repeat-associated protein
MHMHIRERVRACAVPTPGATQGSIPSWAILGEYGNGGANSTGRTEYLWLPTQDGQAIPVGLYRGGKLYAIQSDHLGTPRLMLDNTNQPSWQWPYSAFGDNAPTGILKPTTSAASAFTSLPPSGSVTTATLLATSAPTQVNNLRFPGQYADSETGLFYNYFRSYQAAQGRYTQNDPIGLAGGLNRFGYVGSNSLMYMDPLGLWELPLLPQPLVNYFEGYGSYYGGLGNAASHMWRRAGADGDCEQQRALEDEALLSAALLSLSDPKISKPALAAAKNWASNNKSYIGGRLSAGGVTSAVTGVGVYGGISLGTVAGMGDALKNISRGADNPEQVLRSILGDKMPNLPSNTSRAQCGCRR